MSILKIETPRVFKPLLTPSRYKGAHGGRGSGKSHFFAEKLVEDCLEQRGMLAVCIREVQKSLMQSSKRLLEAKIAALNVGHLFKVFEREIATPGDGVIIFQGMQDPHADEVGFSVVRDPNMFADFGIENGIPMIRVSEAKKWPLRHPPRHHGARDVSSPAGIHRRPRSSYGRLPQNGAARLPRPRV